MVQYFVYNHVKVLDMKTIREIVFATNNAHKLEEARQIVGNHYKIMSLSDIGCHDDIPETADTLEGNAMIKARWVKEHYGFDCFADDTGLMVDALGGGPGVHTARYAGEDCDAQKNVAKMLHELENVTNRRAHFSTVIALIIGEDEMTMEGRVDGTIATERCGEAGFGYDPIFIPEGYNVTFAQMSSDDKNAISHRGRAMQKLMKLLKVED